MLRRFVPFLLVGMLNTAFGYSCYAIALWAGLHYAVAMLVSTVLGVLFNFRSTGSLVFKSHTLNRLPKFAAVYALLYVCNLVVVSLLLQLGLSAYVAGALMLLPMAILAFFLNQKFVFANR